MIYKIKPIDNVLFRIPAPFNASEDYSARSIFPPYPQTYAGVIRAYGTFDNQEIKSAQKFKIGLTGMLLDNTPLFKQPLDLCRSEQNNKAYYHSIEKVPISNYPLEYVTKEANDVGNISRNTTYLPLKELKNYLNATNISQECYGNDDLYQSETHVGITIDKTTKTTEKKRMYQKHMIRLTAKNEGQKHKDISLFFEASGVSFNESSIVKIGGSDKNAILTPLDIGYDVTVSHDHTKYFKLYLASPGIFKNGWLPKWISMDSSGFYNGAFTRQGKCVKLELLAACVDSYVPIGGFGGDYNRPKGMNYAVPAGSVYYFKLLEGTKADAIKLFHQKCISDYRENLGFDHQIKKRLNYCDRGYGYALMGNLTTIQLQYLKGSDQSCTNPDI